MAKCENCYHKQACMGIYSRASWTLNTIEENNCEHFKDKSLVAELPCMVGDILYTLSYDYSRNSYYIEKVECNNIEFDGDTTLIYCNNGQYYDTDEFGETIFHSRKEAVKALEGLPHE